MEQQIQASAFYKSRGFSGRMSESFKFLEKNLKQILQVSIIGLLPFCALSAYVQTMLPQILAVDMVVIGWGLALVCLNLLTSLYFHSFIYAMLQKYAELDYVPTLKLKDWWSLVKKKLGRVFLYNVFISILVMVCIAVVMIPFIISMSGMSAQSETPVAFPMWGVITSLVLFLLLVVGVVPLCLLPSFYLLTPASLMGSFVRSYKIGLPHWGALFGMLLLTLIFAGIMSTVGGLPYYITVMIDRLVVLTDGGASGLPFYYNGLRWVLALLMEVVAYYATLLLIVPMAFQYASLVVMKQEKEQASQLA